MNSKTIFMYGRADCPVTAIQQANYKYQYYFTTYDKIGVQKDHR